ncbi:glycosyltransferase [Actinocorallia longicatena]|uniref:Glycosyltransferase n=1 Tax=Actinocorallia longicatena TaxID=111803 RepID=A0ABP6QG27_9ACTN
MRILFVSPYPPARDGIGTYTRVMSRGLGEAGHTCAVITPRPQPGAPAEVIGALGDTGLIERISAFAPDVVHLQFAVPAFGARTPAAVRLLGRLARLGVPVVATLHEVTRDTDLLGPAGRALYRRIIRGCGRVIVHTGAALDRALALGGAAESAVVVPHFSAEPPPELRSAAELRAEHGLGDHRLLLMFGFVHVHKGLNDLVDALGRIHREDPAVLSGTRLVIAGSVRRRSGPFRIFEAVDHLHFARVRRRARRDGTAPLVVHTSYVPNGDIAGWFGASEAVILPYRKAEQSGVANLARAYGKPVLATTAGGLAELFADSSWTVPPARPDRLAELIRSFLETGGDHPDPVNEDLGLERVAALTSEQYALAMRLAVKEAPGAA